MDASERRQAVADFLKEEPADENTTVVEEEELEETGDEDEHAPTPTEDEEEEDVEGQEDGDDESEEESEEDESEEDGDDDEESEEDESDKDKLPEGVSEKVEAVDLIESALDNTAYPLPEPLSTEKGQQELCARLTDAHHLYAIVDGTGTVKQLMDRVEQFQGKEIKQSVVAKLLEYLKEEGIVEPPEGEENFDDPVQKENKRLREEINQLRAGAATSGAEQQEAQRRQQIAETAFKEITHMAEEAGFSDSQIKGIFIPALGRGVGGNRAIINRIAKGNYIDIRRIFDETRNLVAANSTKKTKQKVDARKDRDKRFPKRTTGNEKHTTAAPDNRELQTSEGRRAAAKRYLS